MEEVKLDPYKGIFKVEGLRDVDWDRNTVYAIQVTLTQNGWEIKAASAPDDNEDIPYMILKDSEFTQAIILRALPILIREMEQKTYKPKNQEEFSFYNQAVNEMEQNYKKLLFGESYPF